MESTGSQSLHEVPRLDYMTGYQVVVPVILPLRSTSISGRPKESILLGSGLAVLTSVTICTALSVASVSLSMAVFVSALVFDSRESRPSVDRYTPCNRNHISSLWNHNDVIKWNHLSRYWPFVRESTTGHRCIPLTKACDAERRCFLWFAPE